MAAIVAGTIFALVALVFIGVTFLDILANAQARVTGGDAGGMSLLPPVLAVACALLATWLFFS